MIASVVIEKKGSAGATTYEYLVPKELEKDIEVGSSVFVPFGHDNCFGFVIDLKERKTKSDIDLKSIIDVLSSLDDMSKTNFELAHIMANDLGTPIVSTLSLMIPSFIKGQKKKYLHIQDYNKLDANLATLFNGRRKITIDKSLDSYKQVIAKEIEKGNITKGYEYYTYGTKKKERVYSVVDTSVQKSKARNTLVLYLKDNPDRTINQIREDIGVSESVVKALLDIGVIKDKEIIKNTSVIEEHKSTSNYKFSFEEEGVVDLYDETSSRPYLLFTNKLDFQLNFIIKIIVDNYKNNKKTVILFSNILSVEEWKVLLRRYLKGYNIVTYHSKNTNSVNFDTFHQVKEGLFDCLLSTPMGIFLPFNNVATIIVNDSEDTGYYSESYPYFYTLEVARKKASLLGSKLVFSSRAPSIDMYQKTRTGEYYLLEVKEKKDSNIEVIDMKEEMIEENNTVFSKVLLDSIKKNIDENMISMLIVNNLAFSTQIKCRKCGRVLKCPKCKLPLMYVKKLNVAKCNYCDYKTDLYKKCKCSNDTYVSLGFGLEQVAEKIKDNFPNAKVLRVDSTLLTNASSMNELLRSIEENDVDIIVGTNALTKLNRSDNVNLISLLYVDSFLNMSDYRGTEYTYNLISSIANYPHIIIQTYNRDNYAISSAVSGSYEDYFKQEIDTRETLNYPPFSNMNMVVIKGEYSELFHFAYYLKKALSYDNKISILGPNYDYVIQGVKVLIKHNDKEKVMKVFQDAVKHFDNPKITASFIQYAKRM